MSQLPPYNVIVATGALTGPQAEGFGTILCVGYHDYFADLYRTYTSLAGMVADGFQVYEPLYLMAAAIFAQSPHPQQVAIGRVTTAYDWGCRLTILPVSGTNAISVTFVLGGETHIIAINGTGVPATDAASLVTAMAGTPFTVSATGAVVSVSGSPGLSFNATSLVGCTFVASDAAPTGTAGLTVGTATGANAIQVNVTYLGVTTTVSITGTGVPATDAGTLATAIHTAFGALTATATGASIAITGGVVFLSGAVGCSITGVGGGFAAVLAAIQQVNDGFYGVCIESTTFANIASASAWCDSSATPKVFFALTQDWTEADGTLGDSVVGTWLAARPNSRTALEYHPNGQRMDSAFEGNLLAYSLDQGPIPTGAFRQLAGVNGYSLTSNQLSNFRAKNTNVFTATKGVYFTWEGTFGGGVFIDVTISLDWLNARIGEAVLEYQLTCPNGRIPYTVAGIQHVGDVVYAVLEEALSNELFAPTMDDPTGKMVSYTDPISGITSQVPNQVQSPQIQLPTPAQCSVSDRAARILGGGGIKFQGRFGGAIHFVNVNGIVLF